MELRYFLAYIIQISKTFDYASWYSLSRSAKNILANHFCSTNDTGSIMAFMELCNYSSSQSSKECCTLEV